MHLWNALAYPFRARNRLLVIVFATILNVIPYVNIFGNIYWAGYSISTIRHLILGYEDSLPVFRPLEDFKRSLVFLLGITLNFLILFILALVGGFVVGFVFRGNKFAFIGLYTLLFFAAVSLFYALLIGVIRAAATNKLSCIFAIFENFSYISKVKATITKWTLLQFSIWLIALIGSLSLQYIYLWAANYAGDWPIRVYHVLGIVMVIPVSFINVVTSISSNHLDAQLSAILGIEPERAEKEKRG